LHLLRAPDLQSFAIGPVFKADYGDGNGNDEEGNNRVNILIHGKSCSLSYVPVM